MQPSVPECRTSEPALPSSFASSDPQQQQDSVSVALSSVDRPFNVPIAVVVGEESPSKLQENGEELKSLHQLVYRWQQAYTALEVRYQDISVQLKQALDVQVLGVKSQSAEKDGLKQGDVRLRDDYARLTQENAAMRRRQAELAERSAAVAKENETLRSRLLQLRGRMAAMQVAATTASSPARITSSPRASHAGALGTLGGSRSSVNSTSVVEAAASQTWELGGELINDRVLVELEPPPSPRAQRPDHVGAVPSPKTSGGASSSSPVAASLRAPSASNARKTNGATSGIASTAREVPADRGRPRGALRAPIWGYAAGRAKTKSASPTRAPPQFGATDIEKPSNRQRTPSVESQELRNARARSLSKSRQRTPGVDGSETFNTEARSASKPKQRPTSADGREPSGAVARSLSQRRSPQLGNVRNPRSGTGARSRESSARRVPLHASSTVASDTSAGGVNSEGCPYSACSPIWTPPAASMQKAFESSVSGTANDEFVPSQLPASSQSLGTGNDPSSCGIASMHASTPPALSSPFQIAQERGAWPGRSSGSRAGSSSERFRQNNGVLPTFGGVAACPSAATSVRSPSSQNAQFSDPQWWHQFQEEHLNIANAAQHARESLQQPDVAVIRSTSSNMDEDSSKKRDRVKESEKLAQAELARLAATREAEARIISSLEATQALIIAARRPD